jgi:hypothetical protein
VPGRGLRQDQKRLVEARVKATAGRISAVNSLALGLGVVERLEDGLVHRDPWHVDEVVPELVDDR